jgi:hypothetical protein
VISVLTALASRSGIERELVSTKTVPASASAPARFSLDQAVSTGTPWTDCVPVGSSSMTSRRPLGGMRPRISASASGRSGTGGCAASSSAAGTASTGSMGRDSPARHGLKRSAAVTLGNI